MSLPNRNNPVNDDVHPANCERIHGTAGVPMQRSGSWLPVNRMIRRMPPFGRSSAIVRHINSPAIIIELPVTWNNQAELASWFTHVIKNVVMEIVARTDFNLNLSHGWDPGFDNCFYFTARLFKKTASDETITEVGETDDDNSRSGEDTQIMDIHERQSGGTFG